MDKVSREFKNIHLPRNRSKKYWMHKKRREKMLKRLRSKKQKRQQPPKRKLLDQNLLPKVMIKNLVVTMVQKRFSPLTHQPQSSTITLTGQPQELPSTDNNKRRNRLKVSLNRTQLPLLTHQIKCSICNHHSILSTTIPTGQLKEPLSMVNNLLPPRTD